MKRFIALIFNLGLVSLSLGQNLEDTSKLTNLIKLDLGYQGLGFTYEPRISSKMTMDLSLGLGGGYDVSEESIGYELNILRPAIYVSTTPKFFYNRQRRIQKGKITRLNSGDYIGLRLKYTTPGIGDSGLRDALLVNLHWGLQRAIGKRWSLSSHIGAGYAKDLTSQFGTVYPALDLKVAYILSKVSNL